METAGAAAVSSATGARRAGSRRRRRRQTLVAWLTILPTLALLGAIVWVPVASTVRHSFTAWDGMDAPWVGLQNYADLFAGGQIFLLLRTNLIFMLSIPVIMIICIAVAVAIYDRVPGWRLFRTTFYIPTILSAAVVGTLAKIFFAPQGVVNSTFEKTGLGQWSQDWLGETSTAFAVLIGVFFWQTLGQGVLIFLAGLSTIGDELLEAAALDGAGWWRRLFHILLPLLVPTIAFFATTNVIYVLLDLFGLVFVITGGGPGTSTTPVDFMIYLKAFQEGDLGSASALAVVLLAIAFTFSWLQIRLLEKLVA